MFLSRSNHPSLAIVVRLFPPQSPSTKCGYIPISMSSLRYVVQSLSRSLHQYRAFWTCFDMLPRPCHSKNGKSSIVQISRQISPNTAGPSWVLAITSIMLRLGGIRRYGCAARPTTGQTRMDHTAASQINHGRRATFIWHMDTQVPIAPQSPLSVNMIPRLLCPQK